MILSHSLVWCVPRVSVDPGSLGGPRLSQWAQALSVGPGSRWAQGLSVDPGSRWAQGLRNYSVSWFVSFPDYSSTHSLGMRLYVGELYTFIRKFGNHMSLCDPTLRWPDLQNQGVFVVQCSLVSRPSLASGSVFAYCKRSKTGAGGGLGTRLVQCAPMAWPPL